MIACLLVLIAAVEDPIVIVELKGNEVEARLASEEELNSLQASKAPDGSVVAAMRIDRASGQIDPLDAGLPWWWLAFGFGAQLLFTGRMLVQWIASERAKRSVVPTAFWILSALGGLMLFTYFLRRGDPVGVTGQAFGLVIYARNLFFIRRSQTEEETA